jgi:hypothetical protein
MSAEWTGFLRPIVVGGIQSQQKLVLETGLAAQQVAGADLAIESF